MAARGLSLVEVLIALFLLSLLLFPVMGLMSQSTGQTVVSFHELQAVELVRELLDQLADLGRSDGPSPVWRLCRTQGISLEALVQSLNPKLVGAGTENPALIRFAGTTTGVLVSPLPAPFSKRYLMVRSVAAPPPWLTGIRGKAYRVTAGFAWNPEGGEGGKGLRTYEADIFLVEPGYE